MYSTRPDAIRVLVAAACILASGTSRAEQSALGDLTARTSTEVAVYTDSDHVTVTTPTAAATVESPLDGWSASTRYLVDVVTAASVDIVATASPRWTEVRHVVDLGARYQPDDLGADVAVSASVEPDYRSLGASVGGTIELRQKNVTLGARYGYAHDTSGRADTPLSVFGRVIQRHAASLSLGLVLGRATFLSLMGDAVLEHGDASKPYRYIPLFPPGTADHVPPEASLELLDRLRVNERPLEQLPLSRARFAATARLAHRFASSTVRLGERVYADDWGVAASTTDLRYLIDLTKRISFGPHLRLHAQRGATFYRRAYEVVVDPDGTRRPPALRTGDRELGAYLALTGGAGAALDASARAGGRDVVVAATMDGVVTEYFDALFLKRRHGLFAALSLDATFE